MHCPGPHTGTTQIPYIMSSVQILTDDEHAELNSIASKLSELSEEYLTEEIDEETYAFSVHDLLAECLPTPCSPAHIVVLKRLKDWKEALIITDEQQRSCFQRVIAASKKGGQSSSSSLFSSNVLETTDLDELLVDEDGETFVERSSALSPRQSPARSLSFDDEQGEMSSPPAARREATPERELQEGDLMMRGAQVVRVLRVGTQADFYNAKRIYVSWDQVKKNCVRKMETVHRWVGLEELRLKPEVLQSPRTCSSPTTRSMADTEAEAVRADHRQQQREMAEVELPARAEHERKRVLPQKALAQSRRHAGEYKTKESHVLLETRCEQFKDNTLIISNGPDGRKLYCRACKKTLRNVWSILEDHCKRHKSAILEFQARVEDDADLKADLLAYYQEHSDEKGSSIDPDEMVFRYRTTETFLASGTPLSVCDLFRPLLQRAGFALTDHSHLKVLIPKIESKQTVLLKSELAEQYISVVFDGTTRLGEAINVVARWCTSDFRLVNRLLDFTTLEKHVDAPGLCTHMYDLIGRQRGVPANNVIGFARDSVSTNGAACRRLKVIYTSAVDLLCICHTLCHVGEHFQLPTLDEFMTPWLELVGGRNPHAGAKMLWKETVAPATVPGYSNVRWYSKAEILFVIGEAGMQRLHDFLRELQQRSYGEARSCSPTTALRHCDHWGTRCVHTQMVLFPMLTVSFVV